jgi:signal peptidase I
MVVIVFGFWFGSQLVLRTQYPALAVVSTSMVPTLNVGDVIIVQGVPASEIRANYSTGDIVVFRDPNRPDYRIVHRAVKIEYNTDGYYIITTHGDNNPPSAEERFHEQFLIGKVIARLPYVGNFALFVNALGNFYYFLIIIIIVINIILSLFYDSDAEKKAQEAKTPRKERKLFGKLSMEMLLLIILNALLIGIIVFNLFGSFAFWQIGAEPPQYVTMRGMYSDLSYQANYEIPKHTYNNVSDAYLSQGIMTYQIDCLVSGNVRTGVTTFSWAQFSILILILLDFWIVAKHVQLYGRIKHVFRREVEVQSIYKGGVGSSES